ncbi:hypothetical protein PHMEG_00019641 [Phytophthora megakarya]|uniref:Uncharacterized protein n=1 Tax=Phytophthora megakarya TaxID=4795 RepID=A0A225VTN2_9STRA|nr:hypothetical protein PHMEG_00019641 [Phytophthora megakarya]
MDSLNYALQPGAGVNVVALSPLELLRQQDAIVAACRKRRAGVPSSVMSSLSIPYVPEAVVPLLKPATLQLVQVRRQHIMDFATGNRAIPYYQQPTVVPIPPPRQKKVTPTTEGRTVPLDVLTEPTPNTGVVIAQTMISIQADPTTMMTKLSAKSDT